MNKFPPLNTELYKKFSKFPSPIEDFIMEESFKSSSELPDNVTVVDVHTFEFPDHEPITIRCLYLDLGDEPIDESEDVWS